MTEENYLPFGTVIADKYEVMDILGKDDFEILYLVRDIHRKGSFFVLKELFLETFSSRKDGLVFTVPEALGVFYKRKKQIIEEIKEQRSNPKKHEIKTYGYEDENNTIYTIMEFSNNAGLEKYLQFAAKDAEKLPLLDELLKRKKENSKSPFFLKSLLGIGLLTGLSVGAFYAYEFFKTTQSVEKIELLEKLKPVEKIEPPILQERVETIPTPVVQHEQKVVQPTNHNPIDKKQVIEVIEKKLQNPVIVSEPTVELKEEKNSTLVNEILKVADTNISSKENLTLKADVPTELKIDRESSKRDINVRLKTFLDKYIEASADSIPQSLKFYDKRLRRYFNFKNATHKTIENSQKRYNKKWVKRDFKISDFKIIKSYKKGNISYVDVQTTTVWHVSNKRGKKLSGKSRGFMTLKEVENGFIIISIYTLK